MNHKLKPAPAKPADRAQAYAPKVVKEWHYDRQLWRARLSADGKTLVASGYDATVQRWRIDGDAVKPLAPLRGHNGWVQGIAFHPTQPWLFAADSWGRLACWNYQQDKPTKPRWQVAAAHDHWIRDVAISSDGKTLATCGDHGMAKLWEAKTGKPVRTLEDHRVNVLCTLFHPRRNLVLTGDLEGKINVFEGDSGKRVKTFDASWLYQHHRIQHCGGVRCLAISPDDKQLICGGQKNPVGAFANGTPGIVSFSWTEPDKKQELAIGGSADGFVYDLQFHPDGFLVGVSCAFPGKGHLWFWQPGEKSPFLRESKFSNGRSVALHAGGKRLTLLASDSANGNGRRLKDGKYQGGRARLRILQLG